MAEPLLGVKTERVYPENHGAKIKYTEMVIKNM